MKQEILEILIRYHQTQMIEYIGTLTPQERETLCRQMETLDFSVFDVNGTETERGVLAPLSAVTCAQIDLQRAQYTEAGLAAVRAGKVGAVMLAGGQGTRLGFAHPKGMYNMGLERTLYIFECQIRNLLEVCRAAEAYVPLFIMVSADNRSETCAFFETHNYFGYSRDHIWFFEQEQLPVLDRDGCLLLADKTAVQTAPNGNGGWYASMEKTGMLEIVRQQQIEWLNVFAVDNVLQRIADPCFVGAVLTSGMVSGAKVVEKFGPDEKVGVLCLEDGRPSIVEYFEQTEEMRTRREPDGTLAYRYGVILNYLFRVDRLDQTLKVRLPLHRAEKKVPYYCAETGAAVQPQSPNAYKFETLALDMVRLQENCLAYEVDRSREFAPVKNAEGADSVETARELLRKNGILL